MTFAVLFGNDIVEQAHLTFKERAKKHYFKSKGLTGCKWHFESSSGKEMNTVGRFVQFVPNQNVDSRSNSQRFIYCLNEKVIDFFDTSIYF